MSAGSAPLRYALTLLLSACGGSVGEPRPEPPGVATLEVFVPEKVARYEPGRSYFGRNGYVEYIPGDMGMILSAAHGGALRPPEIPDREGGIHVTDRNTRELTVAMREALLGLTGRTPHVIISRLLRGATSLGGFLEAADVPSVPSPEDPSPGDAPYFRGGYNTREHGSLATGETVSGIQIEHHYRGVRDTDRNPRDYAARAARALRLFMLEHYGEHYAGIGGRSSP